MKYATWSDDLPTPERPGWHTRAACKGKGELFFNDKKRTSVRKAKELCGACPVQPDCLSYAMRREDFGVWGGMTQNERRVVRRKSRLKLAK